MEEPLNAHAIRPTIDLVIIVVAYHSAADLPGLLGSITAAVDDLSWRLVLVDNSSDAALPGLVGSDSRLTLLDTGANLGYSGGLNYGVDHAPPSRFTVFLNPDLWLEPHALARLAEACRVGRAVASVPLVIDEFGAPQPSLRREPTALRSLGEALLGDHWPTRPAFLAEMVRGREHYHRSGAIDWATGAALMVRSDTVAAIGPWDSGRFFLYSEETDYSRRIRAGGHDIVFTPDAVVSHRGAGSGSSPSLDALLAVNKLRYFRKWHGPAASVIFAAVAVIHNLLRLRRPESRHSLRAFFSATARSALPGGGI
jgi:GT2 family glycosyltransferase